MLIKTVSSELALNHTVQGKPQTKKRRKESCDNTPLRRI